MGLLSRAKEFIMGIIRSNAKKEFNVTPVSSAMMEIAQGEWMRTAAGRPSWIDEDVETINFANFLCRYAGKKACLDLRVSVSGSERADYINRCIGEMVRKSLRGKVEAACASGGMILKPSGTYNPSGAVDYVMPGSFAVTETNANGDILGAIFMDRIVRDESYLTRLEYHHFADMVTDGQDGQGTVRAYLIENKAYKSRTKDSLGRRIPLTDVPEWAGLQETVAVSQVEKPLFAYFRMPGSNIIDPSSPEGISLFAGCMEELKALDIAWSMKVNEVEDSKHMTFIDENRIMRVNPKNRGLKERIKLPRFVQGLRQGVDDGSAVHEHVATLLTTDRLADINATLSMISTKAGFSQGQFVLDRKSGRVTATQIESDDSETVETITDIRNALKAAVKDFAYALDKYCDIFFNMPSGYVNALDEDVADEDIFYFKDLMSTFEQDRARAYQLMVQGVYSKKKYLMEYEGFNEEEAQEMLSEAAAEAEGTQPNALFDEE